MVGPGWPWPPVSATWFEHLVRAFDCAFLEKCAQAAPCWVDWLLGGWWVPGWWWELGECVFLGMVVQLTLRWAGC